MDIILTKFGRIIKSESHGFQMLKNLVLWVRVRVIRYKRPKDLTRLSWSVIETPYNLHCKNAKSSSPFWLSLVIFDLFFCNGVECKVLFAFEFFFFFFWFFLQSQIKVANSLTWWCQSMSSCTIIIQQTKLPEKSYGTSFSLLNTDFVCEGGKEQILLPLYR